MSKNVKLEVWKQTLKGSETCICNHCKKETLIIYNDGFETCGYCMTWTYRIKQNNIL